MQSHACADFAADNLCERDLAQERVCQCLEHEDNRFCTCVCFDDDLFLFVVHCLVSFDRRVRNYVDDLLQNLFDTLSGQCGAVEYRNDVALQDTLCQALVELFVGKFTGIKVDVHQFFINFCDRFGYGISVVQRNNGSAELVLQFRNGCFHVYVVFIRLVDDEESRGTQLFACIPCFFGANLDTGGSIDQNGCCFYASERALYFTCEVKESRRINEVDFYFVIFNRY